MTPLSSVEPWREHLVWRRCLIHCSWFALGFIVFTIAIRPALPRPPVPGLDEKRRLFLTYAAETDTVFIGSSRVFHQFIPRQFDEAMRAAGQPTRSLNLGVDGMVAPESYFAVEDFLSLRPRLKWVFIELQPIQPRFPKHYDGTIRAWWWHDWKNTLLVLRASLREPYLAERSRFETLRAHAALLMEYYVRTGCMEDVLSQFQTPAARKLPLAPPEEAGAAGFAPMTGPPLSEMLAAKFLALASAFREAPEADLPPEFRARLREVAAEVRESGATPLFVITPGVGPREKLRELRRMGIDADLLAFNDPVAFPSLYDPHMFVNQSHLNEAGAREFTRLLAERFAALLAAANSNAPVAGQSVR